MGGCPESRDRATALADAKVRERKSIPMAPPPQGFFTSEGVLVDRKLEQEIAEVASIAKFDRAAYQREYMKAWRAKQPKAKK